MGKPNLGGKFDEYPRRSRLIASQRTPGPIASPRKRGIFSRACFGTRPLSIISRPIKMKETNRREREREREKEREKRSNSPVRGVIQLSFNRILCLELIESSTSISIKKIMSTNRNILRHWGGYDGDQEKKKKTSDIVLAFFLFLWIDDFSNWLKNGDTFWVDRSVRRKRD